MFFILSKVVGFFTLPSNLLIAVGLVGILLAGTRLARLGTRLAIISIVSLAVVGLSPLGNALILPLEDRFPAWDASGGPPDGIVVLGGAVDELITAARGQVALNDAAERMTAAVELARRFPAAKLVFSGGSGRLIFQGNSEAEAAMRLFASLGVSLDRVMLDDRSRDTAENARFSKALASPKPGDRWLLVTSAHHMPRAIGSFRRVGFDVEAYPVDWRTRGADDLVRPFSDVADGLKRTDTAIHEWIGLVAYWLTGRISEPFPGPVAAGAAPKP